MEKIEKVQGRLLRPEDFDRIKKLLHDHPEWNRTKLSSELCREWNWVDATGRIKDMACRTLLLKLHRRGSITLPPSTRPNYNLRRSKSFQLVVHDTTPIAASLKDLRPIQLIPAEKGFTAALWKTLLTAYHYLGFRTRVGHSISYLAIDSSQRPVGCLLFGAAAWKIAPRDLFIGWSKTHREANLCRIANNMRFLIPPWVQVPHLASHLLALAINQLKTDWPRKYGFDLSLLETFVDTSRFQGTCYRAANWIYVGHTTGRTRNDRYSTIHQPPKAIYLYPLVKNYRQQLCTPEEDQ
jgi:hypothetical protein